MDELDTEEFNILRDAFNRGDLNTVAQWLVDQGIERAEARTEAVHILGYSPAGISQQG